MVTAGLPEHVQDELLRRWREPHRRYHGHNHLVYGLMTLAELGANRLELIAFWCHDAVHTNTSPDDEIASARVARRLLADVLDPRELDEVVRLILLTATHDPAPGDDAGARLSDADMSALARDWKTYRCAARAIRDELPQLSDEEFRVGRIRFLAGLLAQEHIFHTGHGRTHWEASARENLRRELAELRREGGSEPERAGQDG